MIWLLYVLPLLLFLAWMAYGIRQISHVSSGPDIGERNGTALLLVDLQTVFWESGHYDMATNARVEAAVIGEAGRAKREGHPVIAVRQEWSLPATRLVARLAMKGQAIAGTPGTEIVAPFAGLPTHTLVKRVQDAFETGELDDLLQRLDIGQLRIAGLDGEYCVARTAEAALNRGYGVTLIEDGIATARANRFADVAKRLRSRGAEVERRELADV